MLSSNEISQQIDQTYKNLLDKFNPTARHIITAGKAYLKALHGASAASKVYLESISKLSSQVEDSPTGASTNIGAGLDQVVEVYKEIQSQQSNILKAFYVDFIVPLESNLEKDAKSLQGEHKRFLTTQKTCQDALSKAELNVRKQRKKKTSSKNAIDKEIKTYQTLDEERLNYETFLERSLKEVKLQERRRYSFVLERLSSLGHHHLALYSKGSSLLQKHIDSWASISSKAQHSDTSQFRSDNEVIYSTPEENLVPVSSSTPTKKRSQSLDGYLSDSERQSPPLFHPVKAYPQQDYLTCRPLSKSKSDYNLEQCHRDNQNQCHQSRRSSLVIPERKNLARATFPFQATADNQLNFEEGDVITLIGEKNKGWQYGENQRTHHIGWFPVAYTECLEDEDSAIGRCSYNNDPPSLQSKSSQETSKKDESTCVPLRGQSLDRLETRKKTEKKVRARSSSNTPKRRERPLPLHSPSLSLRQILIEEEKGRTYYTIRSPSSSCTSENKKSFETYNSHLFLSDDMEEDLESYEGNYKDHQFYHRCKDDKYTSFSSDYLQNHSLSRPLASNEVPEYLRKSVSSRESTHCSDDSGFSKEDNNAKRSSCSYSDCSRSCNSSWVTDSYELCSDRNTFNEDSYSPYSVDGRGSPTFLKYLYPTYKDYNNDPTFSKHLSVEEFDDVSSGEAKKDNWFVNAFGTIGKKKKNLVSPCAQKIASQKARKKNEKSGIHRSSSLLCIDIACTSSPDENCASDYEDINYATWHHKAKVSVPNILPSPPPYDPPPLPTSPVSTYTQYSPQHSENSHVNSKDSTPNKPSESSSGNSSWSESDSSSKEAYMIIKEQNINNVILKSEKNQFDRRRLLTRSYTWASPDFKKNSQHSKGKKKNANQACINRSKSKLFKTGFTNPFSVNERPQRKKDVDNLDLDHNYQSLPLENENKDVAPPLPPRKRPQMPSENRKKNVNILNYSEYMCQRLSNPDGTCRFDQRSFTTGQKCSAWYDLWGRDTTVGNLV